MALNSDTIAVLDFGGQYAHLIANRVRRLGVYSEIVQCDVAPATLTRYKGIIFSGSPHSVLGSGSPSIDPAILALGIPILGLCYGHQLISHLLGGTVKKGEDGSREYGRASLTVVKTDCPLFAQLPQEQQVWMSHGDAVELLPPGFAAVGITADCEFAAVAHESKKIFGLQFHPEVVDTAHGMAILDNFLTICACERRWNRQTFIQSVRREMVEKCAGRKVFLLVSGGVDSSVCFALLIDALGAENVMGLHIDNGLMRHRESADILDYLTAHGFNNLKIEDASADFLGALKGVTDPEQKRGIIGNMFITVKDRVFEGLNLNPEEWVLAQGTIYPDTIESAGTKHADRIKTHHNRVDIILELIERGQVVEPLAQLYKDEVRELGELLGLPRKLVWRHPFPGPGLGVRVLCSDGSSSPVPQVAADALDRITAAEGYRSVILPLKSVGVQGDERSYAHPALVTGELDWNRLDALSTRVTNAIKPVNRVMYGIGLSGAPSAQGYRLIKADVNRERLDLLRAVDHLVTSELLQSGEYDTVWQMPVVLLPLVNQAGGQCVVLRPVISQEAMTATFARLKADTLARIASGAKKIKGLGDLFYDLTHKPPGTIEWE